MVCRLNLLLYIYDGLGKGPRGYEYTLIYYHLSRFLPAVHDEVLGF
jgi:hypothetical protein